MTGKEWKKRALPETVIDCRTGKPSRVRHVPLYVVPDDDKRVSRSEFPPPQKESA